jgi:predicted NUDIX family NTP pyrophosphohydrolase
VTAYKPRSELTQEEAIESITRRELRTVKERFGVSLVQDFAIEGKLEQCLWALVWLFEHRANPDFTEAQLDDFDLGTVLHYFVEKHFDGDETDAGKGLGTTPPISPNGV